MFLFLHAAITYSLYRGGLEFPHMMFLKTMKQQLIARMSSHLYSYPLNV